MSTTTTNSPTRPAAIPPVTAPLLDDFDVWSFTGPIMVIDELSTIDDELSAIDDELVSTDDELSTIDDELSAIDDELSTIDDV
jgi:hypothetical protein